MTHQLCDRRHPKTEQANTTHLRSPLIHPNAKRTQPSCKEHAPTDGHFCALSRTFHLTYARFSNVTADTFHRILKGSLVGLRASSEQINQGSFSSGCWDSIKKLRGEKPVEVVKSGHINGNGGKGHDVARNPEYRYEAALPVDISKGSEESNVHGA